MGSENSDVTIPQIEEKAQADVVFGPDVVQEAVIEGVLEPQLQRFLLEPGFSAIVLAYGQTGSGKTHTIFGPPGVLTEHEYNETRTKERCWVMCWFDMLFLLFLCCFCFLNSKKGN